MKRHVVDRIMRRAANGAAIIYVELAAKAVELAIEHGIDIKEVPALVRGLSKPLEQDTAAAKAAAPSTAPGSSSRSASAASRAAASRSSPTTPTLSWRSANTTAEWPISHPKPRSKPDAQVPGLQRGEGVTAAPLKGDGVCKRFRRIQRLSGGCIL